MAITPATQLVRPRWWPGVAAWALTLLGLGATIWLDHLSRQAGRPDLAEEFQGNFLGPMLALVSAATVGAVLATRRPRHPVGWLLLALGLSLMAGGLGGAYTGYGLLARPGALPATHVVARLWTATTVIAQTVLSFVLLLTPTGSLPTPRWRWWAWTTVAAAASLLVTLAVASGSMDPQYQVIGGPFDFRGLGGGLLVANQLAVIDTSLVVVVAAGSLVMRFRRARGVERQQLRWVAWAAALVVWAAVVALGGLAVGLPAVVTWALATLAVVPVAIGAAILRYRLYDLDRIISRTLPTACSRCCWAAATPSWSSGSASCSAAASPASWWPGPPWPWRRCSSRPAAASRRSSTAASTAAATTPSRRFRRSAPACTSRST
jgi:hypothetical protein